MSDVKDYILEGINQETRATTFNILKGVVIGTPVDEGRAKGNWQVSQGNPILSETDVLDRTGSVTINKGLGEIGKAKQIDFPVMWITNNLPYIQKLNDGSSTQAPKKYIETVIQKVVNR